MRVVVRSLEHVASSFARSDSEPVAGPEARDRRIARDGTSSRGRALSSAGNRPFPRRHRYLQLRGDRLVLDGSRVRRLYRRISGRPCSSNSSHIATSYTLLTSPSSCPDLKAFRRKDGHLAKPHRRCLRGRPSSSRATTDDANARRSLGPHPTRNSAHPPEEGRGNPLRVDIPPQCWGLRMLNLEIRSTRCPAGLKSGWVALRTRR